MAATAGIDGQLAALSLPEGTYDIVVDVPAEGADGEGPGFAEGVVIDDGAVASPPLLATAADVSVSVTVLGTAGPVPGARVTAVSAGRAGIGVGVTVGAVARSDGKVTLALSPGMAYDLLITPPSGQALAARHATLVASAGAATTVDLKAAIALSGHLAFPASGGQPGVRVEAFCVACDGQDPAVPVAETVTGPAGQFTLLVADPGVVP